jgi:hypothetical protein
MKKFILIALFVFPFIFGFFLISLNKALVSYKNQSEMVTNGEPVIAVTEEKIAPVIQSKPELKASPVEEVLTVSPETILGATEIADRVHQIDMTQFIYQGMTINDFNHARIELDLVLISNNHGRSVYRSDRDSTTVVIYWFRDQIKFVDFIEEGTVSDFFKK